MKHPKFDFEMKTYWDTWEDDYQMGEQKHRVYLLNLLKEKGVVSILDVGCGTGPIYEIIQNHLSYPFAYKGVDYSPAMIEIAKKHFHNGDFAVEDARKLSEPDKFWDCVLLMHCLDHLNDYQAAIREAARVAQRYVLIVLWRPFINGPENRLNDRNMMGKTEGEQPWEDTFLHEYSQERLFEEFEKNNLVIEHMVEGEQINDPGHYNWLVLLKKKHE